MKQLILTLLALTVSVAHTTALAETKLFQFDLSKLPLSGSWISSIEDRRKCSGSPADTVVDSTEDFVLSLNGGIIGLEGNEYSATYSIQRVRESETGGSVLELTGVAEGLDETERIRALWFLKSTPAMKMS